MIAPVGGLCGSLQPISGKREGVVDVMPRKEMQRVFQQGIARHGLGHLIWFCHSDIKGPVALLKSSPASDCI